MTIGIVSLWENYANRNIRKSLLVIARFGSFPGLINQCTFGLNNQQYGRYNPATELELIRFRTLPFGDLVWHLSTQMNDGNLAAYITVFDPRSGKHRPFIQFLVYALVYTSIDSNLVTLDTPSPWYKSVCTHIGSIF